MEHQHIPTAETREQSPSMNAKVDLDKYDLIVGRRGCKGYCSSHVHEFLRGWYPRYSNAKNKSSVLQQQIYPEFVSNKFNAYRKDSQGVFCLEEDEHKIIAKLRKELDQIKSKDNENVNSKSESRKRERTAEPESTPQKRNDHIHNSRTPTSNQDDDAILEGEDFLLQAYMDEIPLKPKGLESHTSTLSFRIPEFHSTESGCAPMTCIHPNLSQTYEKDAFQWQDFESYAIPPHLGAESGSPTASTILRSISSGVYVSPETVPENRQHEACAFISAPIDSTHPPATLIDKATTEQLVYRPHCSMTRDANSQLLFSDVSMDDQKHQNKLSIDSAPVFMESQDATPTSKVATMVCPKTDSSKTRMKQSKSKLVPRFNGPSPLSFQVLMPPRGAPPLAPKPVSVIDLMIQTVKQLESRAEAMERENMNVWKRLRELEQKYESMLLSPSKGRDEEEAKSFPV